MTVPEGQLRAPQTLKGWGPHPLPRGRRDRAPCLLLSVSIYILPRDSRVTPTTCSHSHWLPRATSIKCGCGSPQHWPTFYCLSRHSGCTINHTLPASPLSWDEFLASLYTYFGVERSSRQLGFRIQLFEILNRNRSNSKSVSSLDSIVFVTTARFKPIYIKLRGLFVLVLLLVLPLTSPYSRNVHKAILS